MFHKKLLNLVKIRYYRINSSTKHAFAETYKNAFGKHLLFTNTWTSGVLMLIGDLMEQEIEYQTKVIEKRYDWSRSGRMFVSGLIFGPLHHYFYGWLDKTLPKRDMFTISKKIMLDQIVMSPVCILAFFYSMGALERKSLKQCTDEVKNKFMDVYVFDWCIWPPTQFLNFYYLPVKYQVLYVNAVTMVYNVFLSLIKHRSSEAESLTKTLLKFNKDSCS